ncbi:MAG: insulinase family protein [Acidimicrobiia bacterium]|nr:insulinase family protein [Acidimicrobiia bacterium]
MHYDLTTLPNGLRVITETIPGLRSVAVGCWVDTGTRDELPSEAGASHFLEHLLFKGSESLSAREISETFDAMGAQSNAFTSQEYTCFWVRMLDSDLDVGLGLLGEMLHRPAFRQNEIDSERQVVIEEINMNEDDPNDVAFERFHETVFAGHPLERPILGTRESIRAMTRDDLVGYWQRRYGAGSAVIAIAGSVDHEQAVELVARHFGDWTGEGVQHEYRRAEVVPRVSVVHRDTEQSHLVLGGEGMSRDDERRYAFEIMHLALGGGMSSRLFHTIREERGLAYAVYSFKMPFADVGAWAVYAGTTPTQTPTVLRLVREELLSMASAGISHEELERAQGNLRGGLALSLEDPNSRMVRLGRQELTGGEHTSVDERIARVNAVTRDDVQLVAEQMLSGPFVMGAVGPFEASDLEEFVR